MTEDLIDRIYEAAFVPDLWVGVLDEVNALSGSAASSLILFDPVAQPRFKATERTHASLTTHVESGAWKANPRQAVASRTPWAGFRDVGMALTEAERANDPVGRSLDALGLGWQIGTVIPLTLGQLAVITCERMIASGPYEALQVDRLDHLRPHLSRAVLMAARLGLERARGAVATLSALGLPAAVLTSGGKVVAVNDRLERSPRVAPGPYGRLVLTSPVADRMLREILAAPDAAARSRSIPLPPDGEQPSGIAHILPLRGAAHDIFGGFTLLVITTLDLVDNVPKVELIAALYDLTPREAQLATALTAGLTLKQAAHESDLRFSTARSYLERIFRKTGATQQSQLVSLLKGTRLSPPE
ncbi:MAG: LuxR C-terminal-related transcriptional regulator [Methylorubrum rhodinum]|uniref:helix-turn-helix transcriptional regulator n=1 Tax=Methylorubrum rhodinum TaxID=29428 RepID=UPI003BAF0D2D